LLEVHPERRLPPRLKNGASRRRTGEELLFAIHHVNILAFGGENGEKLVENLWKSSSFNAQLSFLTVVLSCLDLSALPVGRDTDRLFSSVSRETSLVLRYHISSITSVLPLSMIQTGRGHICLSQAGTSNIRLMPHTRRHPRLRAETPLRCAGTNHENSLSSPPFGKGGIWGVIF
jgi:hypothetical protein